MNYLMKNYVTSIVVIWVNIAWSIIGENKVDLYFIDESSDIEINDSHQHSDRVSYKKI